MSDIDVDIVRADTPGCGEVIHLNNAGAALPPQAVLTASIDFLETEARQGGYEAATSRAHDLNRVYHTGALLLGCQPEELAFVSSGTQAWMSAFQAVPLEPGDRVLATTSEYVSSVFGLMQLRERDVEVDLIPNDDHGQTSVEALQEMLDERVRLVCATHIPTGGGVIHPVAVARSATSFPTTAAASLSAPVFSLLRRSFSRLEAAAKVTPRASSMIWA